MKTTQQLIVALGIFAALVGQVYAQGGSLQDNIELTNDYEPNLSEIDKPLLETPNEVPKVETGELDFQVKEIEAETEYAPLAVQVPKPGKIKWPPLNNNFLRLGYGRFATPFADLHLQTGRNLNASAGLDFSHISSSNGFVDYAEFREDRGGIHGEYYANDATLGAHFNLDNVNYFYFADSLIVDQPDLKDSIRNTYTRLDFGVSAVRNYDPEAVNYDVGLGLNGYFDRWDNRELHFNVLPSVNWVVLENIRADIGSQLTFTTFKFDTLDQNRVFFDFTPKVTYTKDRLSATAGLRVNSYSADTNFFGAYPVLRAEYQLIEEKLTANIGLTGGMQYNRYFDLIEENRYLTRTPTIRPTRNRFHLNFGLEGGFAKYFTASVSGYTRSSRDELIYFAPEGGAYFELLYDSTYTESGSDIALLFNKEDKIRAGMTLRFRNFNTSTVAYNFNRPTSQIDLFGSYKVADKVWVASEIYLYGNRVMTIDSTGAPIEQGFAADVNLSADYRFSKRVSIFLELNNLLSTSYQNWYNYPVRPFDVKAGVTLSF